MALFTEEEVRRRASKTVAAEARLRKGLYAKSAVEILNEVTAAAVSQSYDVFLSHSVKDADLVLGISNFLGDFGLTVYIDWIADKQLNRADVTSKTADVLRGRMKTSRSLLYITTENSAESKWMPWECGFFDGLKGKVAVVPIRKTSTSNEYKGQEYLGLYPYVLKEENTQYKERLWVHKDRDNFVLFSNWLAAVPEKVDWITYTSR